MKRILLGRVVDWWCWHVTRCECHWCEPYGFVPICNCPWHDTASWLVTCRYRFERWVFRTFFDSCRDC